MVHSLIVQQNYLLIFYDARHRKLIFHVFCILIFVKSIYPFRKENDPEVLHRMAFEHVKKMENYQCLIKCDTGLIAEEIEEITINHPTMVRNIRTINDFE